MPRLTFIRRSTFIRHLIFMRHLTFIRHSTFIRHLIFMRHLTFIRHSTFIRRLTFIRHSTFIRHALFEQSDSGKMIEKPVTKSDSGTQTDTHILEYNIVKDYEWNEWELRRKALKLVST